MQTELNTDHPELNIALLSINKIGAESGTVQAAESGNLPMVNDSETEMIWANWGLIANGAPDTLEYCTENDCGQWRDLFILDKQNQPIAIYNLTLHNLAEEENYTELKQLLIDAASE